MTWEQQLISILLPAILQVESGGRLDIPDGPAGERGPYQITARAWVEANDYLLRVSDCESDLPDWDSGARSLAASRLAAECYLLKLGYAYQLRTGKPPSMAVLARMYNGGPRGYEKRATLAYWKRVKGLLQKEEQR